jgi:hypothetical protein
MNRLILLGYIHDRKLDHINSHRRKKSKCFCISLIQIFLTHAPTLYLLKINELATLSYGYELFWGW